MPLAVASPAQVQITALESFQKDLDASLATNRSSEFDSSDDPIIIGDNALNEWARKALKATDDAALALRETIDPDAGDPAIGITASNFKPFVSTLKDLVAARITKLKKEPKAAQTPLFTWLSSALTEAALKRTSVKVQGFKGDDSIQPATPEQIRKWLAVPEAAPAAKKK